jgi:hypothetical protein
MVEIGATDRHSVGAMNKEVCVTEDVYQNTDDNRFELDINGAVAAAYYELAPGVRTQGLKVIAKCPFVHAYIEKHPEYADLLA